MKKTSFFVVGMHCASCSKLIERKLGKVSGVKEASVNFGSERATVLYEPTKTRTADIKKAVEEAGYKAIVDDGGGASMSEDLRKEAKEGELKDLKVKVYASALLSVVILLGSFPEWFGFIPAFLAEGWVLMLLASPVQFWAGRKFYQAAWSGLKNRTASMDTLVAIGTSSAYFYSAAIVLFGRGLVELGFADALYFDTSAVIITLILLGRYIETRAKALTSDAVKKLLGLKPRTAVKVEGGKETEIKIEEVVKGDIIRVRPGEKVPVDGVITKGSSLVDESMISGESIAVYKKRGDSVIGGTMNTSGSFLFEARSVGEDTVLAQIVRMVAEAQSSKPQIQKTADLISGFFVPSVLILGVITFVAWYLTVGFGVAFTNLMSVLIIACPCALGLATPTAVMVGIGRGAGMGILIRDAQSLEIADKVKTVVFDKTGTLTEGKPLVTEVWVKQGAKESDVVALAASVEKGSEHPLGASIVDYADRKNISLREVSGFKSHAGMGVEGVVGKRRIYLGNEAMMRKKGIRPETYGEIAGKYMREGKTLAYVAEGGSILGIIAVMDVARPSAKEAVDMLRERGYELWMITGDNALTARAVAGKIGIKNVLSGVLPPQKAAKVNELREKTKTSKGASKISFVGDGVNDAPALASSDVGIAMGSGTDIAIESANMTVLNKDLKTVVSAFELSKKTLRTIKENLGWAFVYNTALIPVAAGVLYPVWGLLLNPMLAAFAMAASSISVVVNSLSLNIRKI